MKKEYTEKQLFWMYKDYMDKLTDCGTNNKIGISYKEFCRRILNRESK